MRSPTVATWTRPTPDRDETWTKPSYVPRPGQSPVVQPYERENQPLYTPSAPEFIPAERPEQQKEMPKGPDMPGERETPPLGQSGHVCVVRGFDGTLIPLTPTCHALLLCMHRQPVLKEGRLAVKQRANKQQACSWHWVATVYLCATVPAVVLLLPGCGAAV